MDPSNLSIFKT